MNAQWLRACSLTVGKGSAGLELGALRVVFATRKGDVETPNSAEIRVYNLSAGTANRIRREFTRVVLQAGYQDNIGTIFDGTIRQVRTGRENGTDTWLEIIAADGDAAYNFATVNTTLAAGSKPADRVAVAQAAMAEKGAGAGYTPELGGQALPRGKVMYGMARQHMRNEAETTDTTWSIQDGKVQMLPRAGYLPGAAVVLTHETGLVGTPEQTQDGIRVRSLLNPRLRIGGRIKLDNASVLRAKTDLKASALLPPSLDHDGIYRILTVDFRGDTRGNDWYADMVCIGIDDTSRLPLDMMKGR
ncbi:phage protein [Nitratidesulfovibrio liaohensis]|uniref:Uncharacterized protein n=1 Tax=Nitratidesulfovibrio liaohensis TaxID=2604158 RepID=A0ABY9R624_9BACT|nr:hypothetical protein [Nitratidesulfovibrio liaohensis]WMW66667.1 hypothetical protein KPS_001271 [Nitratidesulfovibrio liaohensis]